jgi:hypothetical protein
VARAKRTEKLTQRCKGAKRRQDSGKKMGKKQPHIYADLILGFDHGAVRENYFAAKGILRQLILIRS